MRRMGSGGMAAALIMGLGVAVAVADEPDGDAKSAAPSGLLSKWLGEKPKPKPKVEKKIPAEDAPAPAATVEMGVIEQKRQMNAVLRRMEVCDRLRLVALQNNNEALMRQADELEARAREIYREQTAHLPMPALPLEAGPKPNERKVTAKQTTKASGATAKEFETEMVGAKPPPSPVDARREMGGDFQQRERSLINSTFMGRDQP